MASAAIALPATVLNTEGWRALDFYTSGNEFCRRNVAWFQHTFSNLLVAHDEFCIYLRHHDSDDGRNVYVDRTNINILQLVYFQYHADSGCAQPMATTDQMVATIQACMANTVITKKQPSLQQSMYHVYHFINNTTPTLMAEALLAFTEADLAELNLSDTPLTV